MGQRQVFQTFRVLPTSRGSGSLPAYSIGRYLIRVAVLDRHRRLVATSRVQAIKVYGQVSLDTLCGHLTEDDSLFGCPKSGAGQASGHVFEYAATVGADSEGTLRTALSSPRTTCRTLRLQIAFLFPDDRQTPRVALTLVQASLDPQTVTATQGELGSLTATLDGGPWQLNTQADKAYYAGSFTLALSGSASCYTLTGV